jgi:hypothetical protein
MYVDEIILRPYKIIAFRNSKFREILQEKVIKSNYSLRPSRIILYVVRISSSKMRVLLETGGLCGLCYSVFSRFQILHQK